MRIVLFIALFWTLEGGAVDQDLTFQIENQKIAFYRDSRRDVVVSRNCQREVGSRVYCDALMAVQKVKWDNTQLFGGASVGSLICRKQFAAKVVIGTSIDKSENSFCKFKDGSLIDIGSLLRKAEENSHQIK